MPSIDLRGVHYAHSDDVPLIHDLTLQLACGWTGVVDPNGSGKTTLLRLLAGALEPDAGSIHYNPHRIRVHLCAQQVERLEPEVEHFADATEGEAQRLRGRLRLDAAQLARWPTLSPGERRRWQIGSALALRPDVLLLDEPTNHLDADGRAELVAALSRRVRKGARKLGGDRARAAGREPYAHECEHEEHSR